VRFGGLGCSHYIFGQIGKNKERIEEKTHRTSSSGIPFTSAIHIGMAIPAGVVRIVLSGKLYGGEEWSSGFYLATATQETSDSASNLASQISQLLGSTGTVASAMGAVVTTIWSSQTSWTTTRAYAYGGGGPNASAVGEYVLPDPLSGGSNSGVPNQVSCVISLRSAAAGRRARGRMYLPLTGYSFTASGQLKVADVNKLGDAWGGSFSDINASGLGTVVIASSAGSSSTDVTHVIVDSKADIQRSRAKQESVDAIRTAVVN